ncbi:MAG: hypothetical protein KZQ66_16165 [Candidatus Thiodiazotropha sp. (ex Lucinoma aequizonata)]|nr:hypothetical protein [Candidatus Thiodiazotropha sp. (ex Lucinoma aequizonata)]MCU7887758.1 hypothetical protein [Candidatus Thiodiazotropha sp. (ex Lucinoma aequizonata)]MCU7896044.1 hypothetical protein [Candidatus Thiodiazotropha sp. (ex Lucinoma aequizonata)]MCU7897223.1 hypothetical protein [Candidatus Thiodiazotropha sp. (ex Lucinoma aequizonata)]MCU7903336.1 hypothetical protein [Candidatus Thiodiazotropha sp. (ex Lucinoma aequizonata)]
MPIYILPILIVPGSAASIENTNGLIRQYFPKGTDFNKVSDKQIEQVMDRLNNQPRRTRGGRSPNKLFMGQRVDLIAA